MGKALYNLSCSGGLKNGMAEDCYDEDALNTSLKAALGRYI